MSKPRPAPPSGRRQAFPSSPLLLLATVSLILPYIGILLCAGGGVLVAQGEPDGWFAIAAGVLCIIVDILIDFAWAHPALHLTDEPTLNRPSADLVGRIAVVVEPLSGGRGKVRLGDSYWLVEGPDMAAGAEVRVVDARDVVLIVAPA